MLGVLRSLLLTVYISIFSLLQAQTPKVFAGQTVAYKQVSFARVTQGSDMRISGTIPATLSDFKIDPPRLLSIPVKNEIPVRVEMTWRPN